MTGPTENRQLYEHGREYDGRLKRARSITDDEKAARETVARSAGKGVKEVRIALDFARHVDQICTLAPES